jgi:hypothetical protein
MWWKLSNSNPLFNRQFNIFSLFLRASQIEETHSYTTLKIFPLCPWYLYSSFLDAVGCVNKLMRLILYKIVYSNININQHCLLQNNIQLMQHIWPSEFSKPHHDRTGSQLLLCLDRSRWHRLQPYEHYQVFENDSPWLSILILGSIKNHPR